MLIAVNEKTHTTTFDMFAVNFIFYSEWAQCLQAQWFLFGLPRHFHLLLCNCLVYRYLYFVVNNNKYLIIYVLLTEFEVRAVSYKPSFSPSIYGPRAAINRRGKNEDPWLTVRTEKTRLVRYLFYLSCVPEGFGSDFYSWGTASNFWSRSKAKQINLIIVSKSSARFSTQFRIKESFKLSFAI